MTSDLAIAVRVELAKFRSSSVVAASTAAMVVGVTVLACAFWVAADQGNEQIIAQLGELADRTGWARLVGVASQVAAAGTVLGFGVVASWVVGREFADGTLSSLYALPVGRRYIGAAKLVVVLGYSLFVAAILALTVLVGGLVIGAGIPDASGVEGLARLIVLVAVSGFAAMPAALAATASRGILAGVGVSIVLVAITQIAVVAGGGAWVPTAAPALWALELADVNLLQLALSVAVPAVFGVWTIHRWHTMHVV